MFKLRLGASFYSWLFVLFVAIFTVVILPGLSEARNIRSYSDLISDSKPTNFSNHTFQFTILTDIAPGGYINLDFPTGFTITSPTTTFTYRNIELYDDGIKRISGATLSPTSDQVVISAGDGGSIRYNLNSSTGISSGSVIDILIGNHTSAALGSSVSFSTTTGTTTFPGDIEPIQNSSVIGTHKIDLSFGGVTEPANAEFNIAVITGFGTGNADTTETVPPYRFNPGPTTTIGGTTLNVEISLETDEFAICKYDTVAGTAYNSMPVMFSSTGLVIHSTVVAVTQGQLNSFYVRCIDDEGNVNIDDFIIAFAVNDQPTGDPNTEGDVDGDGTGTGNDGTGTGGGGGGTTGSSDGESSTTGGSSGGGGSGGGSGGRSGDDTVSDTGGGFESGDAPYRSGDAQVIISGYAFPGSTVYTLVDGTVAASRAADSSGKYSITLDAIARGVYTFGVYAIDSKKVKSSTFSTSFTVTGGRTSQLSNINIMPSILVFPDPVDPGDVLTISGYALPDATITVENQKENSAPSLKNFTTQSNGQGEWSIEIETENFSQGTYKVRAKAEQIDSVSLKTSFSNYTFYGVGQAADVPLNADLNTDGSVNLTDFSILLFWWGGDGGDSNPPADINQDGNVSLTDFSILLFQWTG